MQEFFTLLEGHGYIIIFAALFIEQIGIPLPSAPWLLAAGAMAKAGKTNWILAYGAAIGGSVLADMILFHLGRRYGHRIHGIQCKVSLEPDASPRRVIDHLSRYGMRAILITKFIPGLSSLAPPIAGRFGVSIIRFLIYDVLSAMLYGGVLIMIGDLFSQQLEQIIQALASLGRSALVVLVGFISFYIGYKYLQRYRLLRELRLARITVDELYHKLMAGERLVILDLRPLLEVKQSHILIKGARHASLDDVESNYHELPRDQDIIIYCSCPNEISSARFTNQLHRKGITRVRPLLGGIDAWQQREYPMDYQPTNEINKFNNIM